MQGSLIRRRRQDVAVRLGMLTVILALFSAFAAPQFLGEAAGQSVHSSIPLFEPYRTAGLGEN